jgi:nucleoside-triphosphatase THEP1
MILVAATGPIGCGKTTLLSRLAQWAKEKNTTVDGFLAIANHRTTSGCGADGYDLQWIRSGEEIPFVRRDDSRHPPYEINQEAIEKEARWAMEIANQSRRSLLILDEFGPFEAQGLGHMRYWQTLQAANPEVVVIAVRDKLVEDIQARLGLPFDVVIDATSTTALHQLQAVVDQHSDWIRAGQFGAAAGGFEATVGSALHGASVPMRGLFLSTVQSLLMMYAGDRMRVRSRVVWVPFISAGLKALSPAGSRLRPMLAISIQGILFSLAVSVLGWNVAGMVVGGWLVGAWAASQGILLQYLFIGADYFQAIDTVIRWLVEQLHMTLPGVTALVLLWISLWGTTSAVVTLVAWLRRHKLPLRLSSLLTKGAQGMVLKTGKPTLSSAIRQGAHDLVRPYFWLPVLIVAIIVTVAGSSWERVMWIAVRAVSVGWVFFSVVRMIDPLTLVEWLKRKGLWGPALAFSMALRHQREELKPEKKNDTVS